MNKMAVILSLVGTLLASAAWAGEIDQVVFLPETQRHVVTRNTTLVTRVEREKIVLSKGTVVRVAGLTPDKAFVVSRKGAPDGFVPRTAIAAVKEGKAKIQTCAAAAQKTAKAKTRRNPLRLRRVSGSPSGGSISLGQLHLHVSRHGSVSGSLWN